MLKYNVSALIMKSDISLFLTISLKRGEKFEEGLDPNMFVDSVRIIVT